METEVLYEQWIQGLPFLNDRNRRELREAFPAPEPLFAEGRERLKDVLPGGALKIVQEALQGIAGIKDLEVAYQKVLDKGISFVGISEAMYPDRLRNLPDAPLGLYYKGQLPEKAGVSVAIIGSRDCTEYGRYVAAQLGKYLGERGIAVISGMARGIDGISQQAALAAGGSSYGVLGSGVDICYPASNQELYRCLEKQGGILSTYAPGTQPLAANFPPRNRIVSGLADALVVVEARVKSGTLITVDMALEQGKEVYVVPGRITDRLSDGCNRLLKQGACLYQEPEQFLEELEEVLFLKQIIPEGSKKKKKKREEQLLSDMQPDMAAIWEVLDFQPMTVAVIGEKLKGKYPQEQLSLLLMEMTVEGYAKQVSVGCFCRAK